MLLLQDHGGDDSLLEHRDDVLLLTGPLCRFPGIITVLTTLAAGCTAVIQKVFELEESFRLIEKFRISGLSLLAKMIPEIAAHKSLTRYDLSSVRLILSFSGPVCTKAWETLTKHLDIEYMRQVSGIDVK